MGLSKAERKENAEICKRAKFLRELLSEFGATLVGFDPGVTADIKGFPRSLPGSGAGFWGEHMSFDSAEWKWLEPLLMELRELRAAARK
jgi:hypothetical protein